MMKQTVLAIALAFMQVLGSSAPAPAQTAPVAEDWREGSYFRYWH